MVTECRQVLGSELHYQAMVYHCLRASGGVPIDQIGMNVKMLIRNPVTDLFRQLDGRKNLNFQGGFEPIPDVCLFSPKIAGDWRRRNNDKTMRRLLLAIEMKASERKGARLQPSEINFDILKLEAHRKEALALGAGFFPVMMVIDTAPLPGERVTAQTLESIKAQAKQSKVGLLYLSPKDAFSSIGETGHG